MNRIKATATALQKLERMIDELEHINLRLSVRNRALKSKIEQISIRPVA